MNAEAEIKYCDCHYKHQAQIKDSKETEAAARDDRSNIWKTLDSKVSLKMFYLLIAIFIGTFSFQLLVYSSIRTVETDIAVLKVEMTYYNVDKK